MRKDRRTDRHDADNSRFLPFVKAPEMRSESLTAVTKKFFYKIKPWNPVEIYVYYGRK
jgi:hypothetical protein